MVKNYAEHIESRRRRYNKLCKFIPEMESTKELFNAGIELALKQVKIFDRIKAALEKALGEEIKYAECGTIFEMVSGVMIQHIDFNKIDSPEDILEETILEMEKVLPGVGIAGMVDDSKKLMDTIFDAYGEL